MNKFANATNIAPVAVAFELALLPTTIAKGA